MNTVKVEYEVEITVSDITVSDTSPTPEPQDIENAILRMCGINIGVDITAISVKRAS